MVDDPEVGKSYRLEADLLPLCRWPLLLRGSRVEVRSRPSKNRLIIKAETGGIFKVKRSSFRMAVTEVT